MRIFIFILCFFVFSCTSLQRKIHNINKEYNERKKKENNSIPICPPGAYFEYCGSGCGLPNCGNYDDDHDVCPAVCIQGCVCMSGKVLDESINQCVEVEDCSY